MMSERAMNKLSIYIPERNPAERPVERLVAFAKKPGGFCGLALSCGSEECDGTK